MKGASRIGGAVLAIVAVGLQWWHFTQRSEPFPETRFDFPVR